MLKLWSKRWSTARGWRWEIDRDLNAECPEECKAWLAVFQKDEPGIEFKMSVKKPKLK